MLSLRATPAAGSKGAARGAQSSRSAIRSGVRRRYGSTSGLRDPALAIHHGSVTSRRCPFTERVSVAEIAGG
jgi:hypothetical protein